MNRLSIGTRMNEMTESPRYTYRACLSILRISSRLDASNRLKLDECCGLTDTHFFSCDPDKDGRMLREGGYMNP